MPWSLFISLHGLVLGWTFNISFGAVLAYKEGSLFDKGGTLFAIAGNSTPTTSPAILALSVFAYQYHLFPQGGRYPSELYLSLPVVGYVLNDPNITPGLNVEFMVGATWAAMLPILSGFILGISGLSMRGTRSASWSRTTSASAASAVSARPGSPAGTSRGTQSSRRIRA